MKLPIMISHSVEEIKASVLTQVAREQRKRSYKEKEDNRPCEADHGVQ